MQLLGLHCYERVHVPHALTLCPSCPPCMLSSRCVTVLPPLARSVAGVSPAHLGKKTSKLAWFSHSTDSQDGMCATPSGRLPSVCDVSLSVCVCVLSRGRTCVCVENLMAQRLSLEMSSVGLHEGVMMHLQLAAPQQFERVVVSFSGFTSHNRFCMQEKREKATHAHSTANLNVLFAGLVAFIKSHWSCVSITPGVTLNLDSAIETGHGNTYILKKQTKYIINKNKIRIDTDVRQWKDFFRTSAVMSRDQFTSNVDPAFCSGRRRKHNITANTEQQTSFS